MSKTTLRDPFRDIRLTAGAGLGLLLILVGTVGVWATTAPLSGAIIAAGQVVVESNVRRIQHPTGGIVGAIYVNDGDRVKAGAVLVRLDETTARASLGMIDNQINQLNAREARLAAERDGLVDVPPPPSLAGQDDEPALAKIRAGENALFRSRRMAREGQISQLRERISQVGEEITGLEAQNSSKREQIRLIELELVGVRKLYKDNLISLSRLTSLEREAARLSGEAGQLVAEIARAKGRITETELQILQIDQDQQREIATELREVEAKLAELAERHVAALDQLQRVELRAPQDGVVHQKAVHTIGGVVGPGEQIMLIVPERDGLVVDARVEPQMIDRLKMGQAVLLRFPAFDMATTPDLFGEITRISADLARDVQTGLSYYVVRIVLQPGEADKLGGKHLVPGMPVEAFIQTSARTAFKYLIKPLEDQVTRAFKYD
ncbi:HlyD family type I secretion periplasmic adaptor subunit [Xanthobacter autotrophicus]|uniref:HlyD family type I secretion periplasmic adaptor subunit n=1 Tax=Xanthobacter autotrophicus TaxID=280 RepID=UPI00372B1E59